jgi:hypothetical protein
LALWIRICNRIEIKAESGSALNLCGSTTLENKKKIFLLNFVQVIQTTPKEEQKVVLKKLKEEERRKMALLGEQYEQTIAEMLQKQSVSHQAGGLYY